MRTSSCCRAHVAAHGARRRQCIACGKTWTVRPRRRGRKRIRVRIHLARTILRTKGSLRGMAEMRQYPRETFRRRVHASLKLWSAHNGCPPVPLEGKLVAIVDALWFRTKNHRPAYGCFVILVRPIESSLAYPVALVLLRGKESTGRWQHTFGTLPVSMQNRIVAVVADGFTGLMSLALANGWAFQWCQVHMLRKMLELRGFRNLPGKEIRQKALRLLREFMETSDEGRAAVCHIALQTLFQDPTCPRSIVTRLSGAVKRGNFLRTCFRVPEFNLPTSTNSVERINAFVRERFTLMRGVNSATSLKMWLTIIQRQIGTITCRGYKETLRNRKKFYRKSGS